jgi:hypothetical protein
MRLFIPSATLCQVHGQRVELLSAHPVLLLPSVYGGGCAGIGLKMVNIDAFGDRSSSANIGTGGANES